MMEGRISVVGLAVLVGCSSTNFDVASSPDASDGAVTDSGTLVDIGPPGPGDTGGGTADGRPGETGVACPVLSEPLEVWVDAASTAMTPTGASECAFRQIADAITYVTSLKPAIRTIRVRAGTYVEPVALRITPGLTLRGAGAAVTKISGGGPCTSTSADPQCVIRLEGGGTVDGVDVNGAGTPLRNCIVTYPGTGNPVVLNTSVHGANGDGLAGVLATGGAQLGPNFVTSGNRFGVMAWGTQGVLFTGNGNRVENNTGYGVEMQGSGPLTLTGATVTNNTNGGVRAGHISGLGGSMPVHAMGNSVITNNGGFGIFIGANAGLKMRYVTVLSNPFGLMLVYGSSNNFDLGLDGDLGNNIFGSASGAKNTRGGVCVHTTRSTSLQAVGDRWTKCDPDVKVLSGTDCNTADSYADVWYRGTTAPNLTSCSSS